MKVLVIVASLLLAAIASPASAGAAADLLKSIADGKAKLGDAEKKQEEFLQANQSDMKAYDAISGSYQQLGVQRDAIMKNFEAATAKRMAVVDSLVNGWNSRCAASVVGPLQPGPYQECMRSKGEIEATTASVKQAVMRDADDVDRNQLGPLDASRAKQKQGLDAIAARMKTRFADWERAKATADRLRTDLEGIRRRLIDVCAAAETNEDVHLCASVGWDGANASLPKLNDIRPPSSANPN